MTTLTYSPFQHSPYFLKLLITKLNLSFNLISIKLVSLTSISRTPTHDALTYPLSLWPSTSSSCFFQRDTLWSSSLPCVEPTSPYASLFLFNLCCIFGFWCKKKLGLFASLYGSMLIVPCTCSILSFFQFSIVNSLFYHCMCKILWCFGDLCVVVINYWVGPLVCYHAFAHSLNCNFLCCII